ncbi:MAG: hypothetical protein JETT_0567 [Candidatus Jettenia ecosi]|uniref:Uncharacterized protein n=1 Tax=Candidatus Jettenia ecosi TaxID=2494326 RepID=A0A533QEU0_9BACT|nr:MAG: hypothetical protein JETT_0567 [Candidatus Jettenia ecosi]
MLIPDNPPLEKGEKFDISDQANFSQEKIHPSFPFFKGGTRGITSPLL